MDNLKCPTCDGEINVEVLYNEGAVDVRFDKRCGCPVLVRVGATGPEAEEMPVGGTERLLLGVIRGGPRVALGLQAAMRWENRRDARDVMEQLKKQYPKLNFTTVYPFSMNSDSVIEVMDADFNFQGYIS